MANDFIPRANAEVKNVQEAAAEYAERGWRVFPCHWPIFEHGLVRCSCGKADCSNIGKHPGTKNGHLGATADLVKIRELWRFHPQANIGLATDERNGFTVLDVDPRHGGDRSLANLEAQHGALPETLRSNTGGGGDHIFFQHMAGIRPSASDLGPGLDIKGGSAYVIAPPSLHESGRTYHWANNAAIAPAPAWLVEKLVRGQGEYRTGKPLVHWVNLYARGAAKGQRDSAIISFTGYLLKRGLDPLLVLDMVKIWNRARFQPPLSDAEVEKDVNSICGSVLRKRNR